MEQRELGSAKKELGSWYTSAPMAELLTEWALRDGRETVLDPSFGGLAFLEAARRRLVSLGSPAPQAQCYGVEIDPAALKAAEGRGFLPSHLLARDLFTLKPGELPPVDVILGNPPYVRSGLWDSRESPAHQLCSEMGYPLSRMASMWAPFLLCSARHLREGGRMGLVLPAELLFAQYARPVLRFLQAHFSLLRLALFQESVFPGAQEEVLLLLAEGYHPRAASPTPVMLRQATNLEQLDMAGLLSSSEQLCASTPLISLLAERERAAYLGVRAHAQSLDETLKLGLGIVSGNNHFFILPHSRAREYALPESVLRPVLTKAADLQGALVSEQDLASLAESGRRSHLLLLSEETPPPLLRGCQTYLEEGVRTGVPLGFKCRSREPWYAVPLPGGGVPDLLLTYISGKHPRLGLNQAGALATNALHGLWLPPLLDPAGVVVRFYTSFTLLSAELVGRSYGGGALKLEPGEARQLALPPPRSGVGRLLPQINRLLRKGELERVLDLTDREVLRPAGVSEQQCASLREGWRRLSERRGQRGKRA